MNKLNTFLLFLGNFLLVGLDGIQCFQNETESNYVSRTSSPSCELKSSVKSAILNIEKQVQTIRKHQKYLESKLNDIASLLKKPENGKNCADLYEKGIKENGAYQIDPDGKGSFKVLCDMTTSGGGWTVFQRRLDGSVDFYRGWQDYKNGFGDLNGEFWLGLDKIHRLTTATKNELRIDMEDTSGNTKYAEYDLFAVTSEEQKYQLSLGTYSGTAGDSFARQKGQPFTTKDSDNDNWPNNCAQKFKGAWWHNHCHRSNLNGLYHHGSHTSFADGVNWYHWKGYYYSLKSTSMKIRPREFGLQK